MSTWRLAQHTSSMSGGAPKQPSLGTCACPFMYTGVCVRAFVRTPFSKKRSKARVCACVRVCVCVCPGFGYPYPSRPASVDSRVALHTVLRSALCTTKSQLVRYFTTHTYIYTHRTLWLYTRGVKMTHTMHNHAALVCTGAGQSASG